ncbi:DUF1223 domain-containing protein [Marixanthomonas ophiurae]|uniref:DUF1223 domain-containing protein n=1 Tax=Marixanthomonas ophiurae TaxID=387659 RepID=A0A3E1Q7W3_9FLAO|nr:DUF1223 domain-containing protein [Marixanthomonas ophiurae]RFN58237.1 DUF1223 domain-containing protein [Marixanthomonas ophiurae]
MKYLIALITIPLLLLTTFCKPKDSKENINKELAYAETTNANPFALVQLFTSQGCSSCPPADRLLDKVKEDYDNVAVLSYHVDYWNRLGWKDPFSKKKYTDLQYAYGSKFGDGRVYTPQAVINGSLHFVGSNEAKMKGNLSKFLKNTAENTVVISEVSKNVNTVSFNYKLTGGSTDKKLKLALVIGSRETPIGRGENGGKTLLNTNIVVQEVAVSASETLGSLEINIPDIVKETDELSLIGFVQQDDLVITGATKMKV